MKDFLLSYDGNKNNSGFYPQSDTIYRVTLSAGTMKTIEVPVKSSVVEFKSTNNFYCKFDDDVTVPSADITDGTSGELNPDKRVLRGVNEINLISTATCVVTLSFYNIPGPTY